MYLAPAPSKEGDSARLHLPGGRAFLLTISASGPTAPKRVTVDRAAASVMATGFAIRLLPPHLLQRNASPRGTKRGERG